MIARAERGFTLIEVLVALTIGMEKESQNRTKRAAFSPASMLSVPAIALGWLATMPIDRPSTRPKPMRMFGAYSGCTSRKSALSTTCSMTVCMSYGWLGESGMRVSSLRSSSVISSSTSLS